MVAVLVKKVVEYMDCHKISTDLLRYNIVIYMVLQGRSQTSEQDEASFERQRHEPLGGSGGMPPRKF